MPRLIPGGAFFQTSQPASLAVTGSEGEISIPDKLHDHADHVFIRKKSQQLAGEATVPDSVISSCHIYKHGFGLLFLPQNNHRCFVLTKRLDPQLTDHGEIWPAQTSVLGQGGV